MPNQYRFTLGKVPDTSVNLVTNGTFTGSLTGWSAGSLWTYNANTAEFTGTSGLDLQVDNVLKQTGILSDGQNYYLSYDLKRKVSAGGLYPNTGIVSFSLGGTYYAPWKDFDQNDTTTFVNQVHKDVYANGSDFLFFGYNSNCTIDNVLLYRKVWNSPLVSEPLGWDKSKITKRRDDILNGLIVNYISNLTFIEDGFDYLYNEYLENGFCSEVQVKVDKWNSVTNVYEVFFEGFIYLKNCNFNISKRQVEVSLEDANASLLFLNNKNVKCPIGSYLYQDVSNNYPLSSPDTLLLIDFNNDAGAYTYTNQPCYLIYNLFKNIINLSNDFRFDFDSSFFSSGTFQYFCMSYFKFAGLQKISFQDLFKELNCLFNLSFSIDNSGVKPKIIVEPKIDYYDAAPVLVLDNVNDLKFTFDEANIYKTIEIGYKHVDDNLSGTYFDTPNGNQYYTSNLCATNNIDLVSNFIQKSTILKNLKAGLITDNKYANEFFFIETDGTLTTYDGLTPNFDYNPNINEINNLERHLYTLNTDFVSSPNGDILNQELEDAIKANASIPLIYSFEYPITKAQFDLIVQAYNTIEFNTDGTGLTTKEGFVLSAEFDIGKNICSFKVLSS